MDFDDNRWKVYKSQYLTGEKQYWLVYRRNDFGEPLWICDTFEEAWERLDMSMGTHRHKWRPKIWGVLGEDICRCGAIRINPEAYPPHE